MEALPQLLLFLLQACSCPGSGVQCDEEQDRQLAGALLADG